MHPKTAARHGAIKALLTLEDSDVPLSSALGTTKMPDAAQSFARELVSGVCRHRARLDYSLQPLLKIPLQKLDAPVRAALRLAAYERLVLQTPHSAIVDEYAEAMRVLRLRSAVGFVNAVARRLPQSFPPSPDAAKKAAQFLNIEYSHPAWLVERWLARLGFPECEALCAANNEIAPLHLRVNAQRAGRDEVLAALRLRGLDARAGKLSADAIIIERGENSIGSPVEWPEWKDGAIIAQDEAAQLVARLANPEAGWIVIDACAAPGGKSTHLAQMMSDNGNVIACDLAPGRLKLVRENAERLQLESIETRAGDIRELSDELPKADLVLLDAPCLGTGTWRRRPDARWRKTKSQLAELAVLQNELLQAASQKVKRGGFLVYSTCSLEAEENEKQVRAFLQQHECWQIVTAIETALQSIMTPEGFLQTWPHRNQCDGMFAAKLQRVN